MLKKIPEITAEIKKAIPEVDAAFVKSKLDPNSLPFLLIDVREPHEHAQGMIPGATPIPRGILEMNIERISQDAGKEIVCYCGGGTRSLFAAEQLQRMGYKNVKSMAGGFKAWTTAGYPVVAPQRPQ
ncbi:MAG TPA: rhodanese-like domain-containing protein [Planctomycetota bacterium]|nr:rhodanese-like domain-containing protein [Planctomycetota bacterium]